MTTRYPSHPLGCLLLTCALATSVLSQPLPRARPAEEGFSSERLEKMHALIQGYVDGGRHAGAISMIVRDGQIVDWQAYGYRDLEAKAPITIKHLLTHTAGFTYGSTNNPVEILNERADL